MTPAEGSERQLLTEALEREFRNVCRMMRAFPAERAEDRLADCPRSARELAWAFVERERRLHSLLRGRPGDAFEPAPRSLYDIRVAYEDAHRETSRALSRLTPKDWGEAIHGPPEIGAWERGRRGEQLWTAWKELVHHGAHFAVHVRAARQASAAAALREAVPAA
jgi:hypothetical protein